MNKNLTVVTLLFLDQSLVNRVDTITGTKQHDSFDLVDAVYLLDEEPRQILVGKSRRYCAQITRAPLVFTSGPRRQPLAIGNKEDTGSFMHGTIKGLNQLVMLTEHLLS